MSRKHFVAIAARISSEVEAIKRQYDPGRNPEQFIYIIKAAKLMADVCNDANENFNYQRFLDACNLPDIDMEKAMAALSDSIVASV